MSTSPIAIEFARRIAPRLVAELEERKTDLIANSGSWPIRQAARLAWDPAIKAVPSLTEAVCDAMLDEFGNLTLADVAGRLIAHQTAKGRRVHASLREVHDQ
jgi:hypothetical protein